VCWLKLVARINARTPAAATCSRSLSEPSARCAFVAWLDDKPVGAIELFLGSDSAGIHALSVLDTHQRRGIGSALIEHACNEARHQGAPTIGLLATTEGQRLYERRGFREVARFGYWYRSFQRSCRANGKS